jgi:hypothetical protein
MVLRAHARRRGRIWNKIQVEQLVSNYLSNASLSVKLAIIR